MEKLELIVIINNELVASKKVNLKEHFSKDYPKNLILSKFVNINGFTLHRNLMYGTNPLDKNNWRFKGIKVADHVIVPNFTNLPHFLLQAEKDNFEKDTFEEEMPFEISAD